MGCLVLGARCSVLGAACLVLGAVGWSTGVGVRAAKQYVAERFDVTAVVQPDGSLEVTERIAFRFSGGEFTEVSRELPARETDGVDVIEASIDGQVPQRGGSEGQVEVSPRSSRTRVIFRFAPARDTVRVFSLRYRYAGVVRYGEGEDWFQWRPYPARFDYRIDAGDVRVTWPVAARARRLPDIEGAAATTTPLDHGFALTVANYRERDEDVRVTMRFEPGAFQGAEPQWQRDARRADRLAPAFIAAGLMIGAATALALWLFFLRYRREPVEPAPSPESMAGPPDDLSPALAGAIASGRVGAGGAQLLAAAFDLARRGVLKIEERPAEGFLEKRAFAFHRGVETPLRPHERAVVDALFRDGQHEAPFAKGLQRLSGHAGKIGRVIGSELDQAGFIDRERKEGGRAMTIAGVVVMGFATVLAFVAVLTSARLGGAAMLVPAAFGLAGLVMVMTGAAFSTLSPSGAAAAGRWQAYGRQIKAQAKQGRVPDDGEAIGRMLPYAAALGVLSPFGKALERSNAANVPAWLRTLDAAGGHAAMVAMIASASSAVPHAGGGGAGTGGGVGGGSSGAR